MDFGFRSPLNVGVRYPVWSSYGPRVMEGIVDFMRNHEAWHLVTENDSFGEMEAVRIDRDWLGDGAVLFRATDEELAHFRKRGTAIVLTSTEGPDAGYPRVVSDNARVGALAAEHLIACAVPHFAFLARGETVYLEGEYAPGLRRYSRERLGGFRAKLKEYSREPVVHYLRGRPLWKKETWREVEMEVVAFLDSLPKPCGLFAVDDALGAVVLRAAKRLDLRVPSELAVIGFGDDASYCFSSFPALSTIAFPAREVGYRAAELLRRQMSGQEPAVSGRLQISPGAIIPRESSDTLAIADPEVLDLVRHIRLHAPHDPLRVSELAERSRLSLTTIKARFSAVLGHGPKQAIQQVRLAHLRSLLTQSSSSLSEIAGSMGFGSAHELSRFFLGETGERPSEYRRKMSEEKPSHPSASHVGVVFDMDGTLFETEPVYFAAYRHAFEGGNRVLTWEQYRQDFLGASNAQIEATLIDRAAGNLDPVAFRKKWRECWHHLIRETPPVPLPGVIAWLEGLCEERTPIGLASSSDLADIDLCLEASGLAGYFTARAGGDEVAAGKPAPDVYLLACERLGIDPQSALAIEDSPKGIASALAAGLQVIRVGEAAGPQGPSGSLARSIGSLADLSWREGLALLTAAPARSTFSPAPP
jgi:LacI family transcriptional regulator